jgi:hypothetical protein
VWVRSGSEKSEERGVSEFFGINLIEGSDETMNAKQLKMMIISMKDATIPPRILRPNIIR